MRATRFPVSEISFKIWYYFFGQMSKISLAALVVVALACLEANASPFIKFRKCPFHDYIRFRCNLKPRTKRTTTATTSTTPTSTTEEDTTTTTTTTTETPPDEEETTEAPAEERR